MNQPAPSPAPPPVTILVDADACPVKEEIYRVARRHAAHVAVVSNSPFRVPVSERVRRVVVGDEFDAADDWIAGAADARSVVVTGDILLAERCLKTGATVLKHDGREFDAASIGSAIATRDNGRFARRDGRRGRRTTAFFQGRPLAVFAGAGPGTGGTGTRLRRRISHPDPPRMRHMRHSPLRKKYRVASDGVFGQPSPAAAVSARETGSRRPYRQGAALLGAKSG